MHKSTPMLITICLSLSVAGFCFNDCFGKPAPNERRHSGNETQGDVHNATKKTLHGNHTSSVPVVQTTESNENYTQPIASCYENVSRNYTLTRYTFEQNSKLVKEKINITRIERQCCQCWRGKNCHIKPPFPEFDPEDPCKKLKCEGNAKAECFIFKRCGRYLPVFLEWTALQDVQLSRCNNSQPIDLTKLGN